MTVEDGKDKKTSLTWNMMLPRYCFLDHNYRLPGLSFVFLQPALGTEVNLPHMQSECDRL